MTGTSLTLPTPLVVGRPPRAATRPVAPALTRQLIRFCVLGVSSTGLQLGLYLLLRGELGAQSANVLAMVISTVVNVEANRRWAFGRRGWRDVARHHARAGAVFLLSLGVSSAALALLGLCAPGAGRLGELVVLVAANTLSAVLRFVLLRTWAFASTGDAGVTQRVTSGLRPHA